MQTVASPVSARLQPDDRKVQLLEVAEKHFATHGYAHASMMNIAKEAKVGRALLYHYYPSKAMLLEAVIVRQSDELLDSTKPNPAWSVQENLQHALAAYIDYQAKAANVVLTLRRSDSMLPKSVQHAVSCHHDVHIARIIDYLQLEDTPLMRGALSSWLGFIAEMARYVNDNPEIARDEVIQVCMHALEGIVGSATKDQTKQQRSILGRTLLQGRQT